MSKHHNLVTSATLRRRARAGVNQRLQDILDSELDTAEANTPLLLEEDDVVSKHLQQTDVHNVEDVDLSVDDDMHEDHDDPDLFSGGVLHEMDDEGGLFVEGAIDAGEELPVIFDDFDKESSCTDDEKSEVTLAELLACWALLYGVPIICLSALLSILCKFHPELPKDGRTLLKTKTTGYTMQEKCGGLYHYFGILNSLRRVLIRMKDRLVEGSCLMLQINIDGLPLFKSSSAQLWPILGLLVSVPMKEPVVIGLFSGCKKPTSSSEFLEDMVTELKQLEKGFDFEGKSLSLKVHSVICDTPARSFVKNVKAHNGYSGCDKCSQTGMYVSKRMTFPLTKCQLRTDESFSLKVDEDHHREGPLPFQGVTVGLVSQFPLDYMHLVCLGVVRRMVNLWLKGPLNTRLPSNTVKGISENLVALRPYIPEEFARKPRPLSEVDRWKATEFRQFLLYTGPVVLAGVLDTAMYGNFMLLFSAVAILVSPQFSTTHCDYAQSLLETFVKHFGELYGKEFLVYNVHALVHLAHDVQNLGYLDSISAFPFESYLHRLKKLVRKPRFPLAQIIRRLSEESPDIRTPQNCSRLKKQHCVGPVPSGLQVLRQYSELVLDSFTIKTSTGNNVFVIHDNICCIYNILECKEAVYVVYKVFTCQSPFFRYPFDSAFLSVLCVSQLGEEFHFTEMYLVVKFLCDETVNIVPSTWYADGKTWWPNYPSDAKINKAVRLSEPPGHDWQQYDARILCHKADYLEAREKLRESLYCQTSDLQSEADDDCVSGKKRLRKANHRYFDSESDEDERCMNKRPRPLPPPVARPPSHCTKPVPLKCQTGCSTSILRTDTEEPLLAVATPKTHFSNTTSTPARHDVEEPISITGQVRHMFKPSFRVGRTSEAIPCTATELHILTLLENIRQHQVQLAATVNTLLTKTSGSGDMASLPEDINFPMASKTDVTEFELWLKDDCNTRAKQNLVAYLAAIGGIDLKRVTWNILAFLFAENVAKMINWKGVNGKMSFASMATKATVIRAVRKNQLTQNATNSDIEKLAIRWFGLALDRGGGRKARAVAASEVQANEVN